MARSQEDQGGSNSSNKQGIDHLSLNGQETEEFEGVGDMDIQEPKSKDGEVGKTHKCIDEESKSLAMTGKDFLGR